MADMRRHRLPKPVKGAPSDARENVSRADGASLALGSTEYRERVADLRGMDEFEQERDRLAQAGLRKAKDFSSTDERAKAHDEMVSRHADQMRERFEDDDYGVLSTGERVVSHEIKKSAVADKAYKRAQAIAAETESKEDDKFVARRLPRELDRAVYDEGKDDDDIYPGMSTLNKYM